MAGRQRVDDGAVLAAIGEHLGQGVIAGDAIGLELDDAAGGALGLRVVVPGPLDVDEQERHAGVVAAVALDRLEQVAGGVVLAAAQQRRRLAQLQVEAIGHRRGGLAERRGGVVPAALAERHVGPIDQRARELRLDGDHGVERAGGAVEIAGAELRPARSGRRLRPAPARVRERGRAARAPWRSRAWTDRGGRASAPGRRRADGSDGRARGARSRRRASAWRRSRAVPLRRGLRARRRRSSRAPSARRRSRGRWPAPAPAARVASSVRLARALRVAISAGMAALFGSASAARR